MKSFVMVSVVAMVALSACKKDQPESGKAAADYPDEPRPSEVDEPEPSEPTAAKADPHAGMGSKPSAAMTSPGPGPADLGGLEVTVPKDWQPETPTSRMRVAQYAVGEGDARVDVVVFYFGPRGAGGVEANLERWQKQFSKLEGQPERDKKLVRQMKVHMIDMTGTFGGGPPMRPMAAKKAPREGVRMVGAIVEAPAGAYYFKMSGPKVEVEEAKDGFADMIESAKPSEL